MKPGVTREFLPEFDACMETSEYAASLLYSRRTYSSQSLLVRADKVLKADHATS